MEWERFQRIIELLFGQSRRVAFEFDPQQIRFSLEGNPFTFTLQEFDRINETLSQYEKASTYISKDNEIEMLIDSMDTRFPIRNNGEPIEIADASIIYKIAPPSHELILSLLSFIQEDEILESKRHTPISLLSYRINSRESGEDLLFDLLLLHIRYSSIRFPLALRIITVDKTSIEQFKKYANSFIFNLSYNTGSVLKPVYDFSFNDSILRRSIVPPRSLRLRDMETPKLFYITELTEQYNLALYSNDPFIMFIAFYHIMEYFFDEVYNSALISGVKEILTHPSFSLKKTKEISKIIELVQKKTRYTKEEFLGTELEALELTIKSYIPLDQLYTNLNENYPKLIDYYKTHEVFFSNGDKIDLADFSNDRLPKKIAARIYKTRNSLVHNKSNNARVKERGLYHPFIDDKELFYEIPLMRLIAETIIINSAKPI